MIPKSNRHPSRPTMMCQEYCLINCWAFWDFLGTTPASIVGRAHNYHAWKCFDWNITWQQAWSSKGSGIGPTIYICLIHDSLFWSWTCNQSLAAIVSRWGVSLAKYLTALIPSTLWRAYCQDMFKWFSLYYHIFAENWSLTINTNSVVSPPKFGSL